MRSTSINQFRRFFRRSKLFAIEQEYEQRSRQANLVEGRYFPGFFTVLTQRIGS